MDDKVSSFVSDIVRAVSSIQITMFEYVMIEWKMLPNSSDATNTRSVILINRGIVAVLNVNYSHANNGKEQEAEQKKIEISCVRCFACVNE